LAIRPVSDGPIFERFENTPNAEKAVQIRTMRINREGLVVESVKKSQTDRSD